MGQAPCFDYYFISDNFFNTTRNIKNPVSPSSLHKYLLQLVLLLVFYYIYCYCGWEILSRHAFERFGELFLAKKKACSSSRSPCQVASSACPSC